MFSIVVPPIAVIFLVGVFFKRGNGDGAFWTLLLGTGFGIIIFILSLMEIWNIHYTINVGIAFAVSSLIFILISYFTKAPDPEKIALYTYRKELLAEGMHGLPWYQDYRVYGILLLVLIGSILVYFW